MRLLNLWLLSLVILPTRAVAKEDFRRMQLRLGESITVNSPGATQWHAHKNHIVEVMPAGDSEWRLVAVSEGLVILEALNEQGKLLQRLLVTVVTDHGASEKRDTVHVWPPYIAELCRRQLAVRCEGEKTLGMSGVSDDPRAYLELRQYCLRHMRCAFSIQLTEEAELSLKDLIGREQEVAADAVTIGHDGTFLISLPCGPMEKNPAKSSTKGIEKRCTALGQKNLWLQFNLSVIGNTTDAKSGVLLRPLIDGKVWDGSNPDWGFENQEKKRKQTVLGQPIFRVLSGQEASFSGGSEFFVGHDLGLSKAEPWKKVGMSIKVLPQWVAKDQLRLAFTISLAEPKAEGGKTILQHELQSEQLISFEEETVLAVVATEQNAEEEISIPLLSDVPIIGPLFKRHSNGEGKTFLRIATTAYQHEPQAISALQ